MDRVPTKHNRNQAPDFEGFLNNLQDWEQSYKDKDKKLKSQSSSDKLKYSFSTDLSSGLGDNGRAGQSKERGSVTSQKIGIVGENGTSMRKTATSAGSASTGRRKDYLGNYDAFMTEDSSVDANSEKELGNNYFKQKKYKEAIDCYSRSLAFSPTAVAYANRAMAYLKLKRVAVVLEGEEMYALTVLLTQNDARNMKKAGTLSSIVQSQCVLIFGFQEAEDDCTEALNLDDRYIKAYSRRSTARKELGKLKGSFEDAEFALRLEPQNQEIKKQYTDAKSMYDKELLKKASGALRDSTQVVQNEGKGVKGIQSVPNSSQVTRLPATQEDRVKPTSEVNQSNGKKDLKASLQELAARAASLATAEAAKTITPPSSAYQFEASWRGLSGDRTLQARLLKATSPVALPQIFKNALSAPLLIDIVRCIATFFSEEVDLAVNYLDNLSKVPRFDMIIMCLSSADKADLQKIWDETFCSEGTSPKYSEILCKLRSRYCNKL